MRVSGRIERLSELPVGSLGRLTQIRARLLHEASQRKGSESEALGVELQDGLAEPLALVQRLGDHRRYRLSLQFGADAV
jgi:hypothetical protein